MTVNAAPPTSLARPARVLFLGSMYAGHATRYLNLKRHAQNDPRIRPTFRQVNGWAPGGAVERAPLLPSALKGRLRAALEASAFAALPRPDAIWTAAREVLLPHIWSQVGPLRRPLTLDLDWTLEQQEAWAPLYFDRAPKRGLRLALARLQERAVWRTVSMFTPWSNWAADSLRRNGVPAQRVRVIHPGVDLEQWRPQPELRGEGGGPLRLLLVGGDFVRKGGDMLLDVIASRFAGRCELDVVTRDAVEPAPGVRLHRAEPNSPRLRELYARADLFVMPSRAECFGIATVEALASGLPAIVGDVGGARDIVSPGETGWLIEPTAEALAQALEQAVTRRDDLPAMGARARQVAESRFDGRANDRAVIDTILETFGASRQGRAENHRGTLP